MREGGREGGREGEGEISACNLKHSCSQSITNSFYRVYTTMVRYGTAQHGTVRNGYRVTFTRVCGYVV